MKKARIQNGMDVEKYIEGYNTWSTMYKENYCNDSKKSQKTSKKRTSRNQDMIDDL